MTTTWLAHQCGALAFTNTKDIAMKLAIKHLLFTKVVTGSALFLSTAIADALPVSSLLPNVEYSDTLKKVSEESCRQDWLAFNDTGVQAEARQNLETAKEWYSKGKLDFACTYLCGAFHEAINRQLCT
jgi:hypothetical protein